MLASGEYAVFTNNSDPATNGGITPFAAYGPMLRLGNGGDSVSLSYQGTVIDTIAWDGSWPGANGTAICLRASYPASNDAAADWSAAVGSYGPTGDLGAPGVANDATNCP